MTEEIQKPRMNWKRWKVGLAIAAFTGSLTGVVGIAIGITWQQAAILVVVSVAKECLMFLHTYPIESISDTGFIKPAEPK